MHSHNFNDIYISKNSIIKIMQSLEATAASGPVGIPAIPLKKCAKERALLITLLGENLLVKAKTHQD